MKTVTLEVFIETGCKACVSVMHTIREVQSNLKFDVIVYRRDVDIEVFKSRKVVITPAIFIDGVLTFYGEVSSADIRKKIYQASHV